MSIILKGSLATYELDSLPVELCLRNPGLYGALQIIGADKYEAGEKTKDGRSKAGWKMVRALADDDFLEALTEFPKDCLLYTSPSPRDLSTSRMPSSA